MREKENGFTLIELMVTIAVLAIIAMMAAPSFGDLVQKQQLKKSTNELIGVLSQARSKAILERRNVKVELHESETILSANSQTIMYWMPYGETVLTSSVKEIVFGLSGGVVGASADTTFVLCGNGVKQVIAVSRMGTVQQVDKGVC
ncbi:Tfp pilus assembly protein FimT/FimU [Acinetobacter sp. YH12136]|uniref:pilus assembly FimT family protein n=1 Tax=Acinetobacter sp. YH12136 TaxID=2601120 RepID=UPI0015D23655|nr:GspH/FimT family pseudopilin [Acinetobacter sp. YH12136]